MHVCTYVVGKVGRYTGLVCLYLVCICVLCVLSVCVCEHPCVLIVIARWDEHATGKKPSKLGQVAAKYRTQDSQHPSRAGTDVLLKEKSGGLSIGLQSTSSDTAFLGCYLGSTSTRRYYQGRGLHSRSNAG